MNPYSHKSNRKCGRRSLILYSMTMLIGMLAACSPSAFATEEPPGVGEKAFDGYMACAPIIECLKKYHEANGAYPESLQELVPDYILEIPESVNDAPITYEKTDESYALSFSYIGPGMNYCTYSPFEWKCSGAY